MITLEWGELERAAAIGLERDRRGRARYKAKYGAPRAGSDDSKRYNVLGTYGEFAAARFFGLPEPTMASLRIFTGPDLPNGYQVRARNPTNRTKNCDHMIIRPKDQDHLHYVLVHVRPPYNWIIGELLADECKRDEWRFGYGSRPVVWFVPPDAVRPLVRHGAQQQVRQHPQEQAQRREPDAARHAGGRQQEADRRGKQQERSHHNG